MTSNTVADKLARCARSTARPFTFAGRPKGEEKSDNILPFPVDYAARPLPCDYYDDSEGMDEVFAGWRASARRWLGYAAMFAAAFLIGFWLAVGHS